MKVVCLESQGLPIFAASPQVYQKQLEDALNSQQGRVIGLVQKQIGRQVHNFVILDPLGSESQVSPKTVEPSSTPKQPKNKGAK